MNSELQAQTDAMLQAFNTLHDDLSWILILLGVVATALVLILIVLLFRRRWQR
jgi:hypothetical protein